MSELPPLPEPVMTETNPHFGSGHDPYNGAQFLNWHTPDQLQAYARAAVAAEREACAAAAKAAAMREGWRSAAVLVEQAIRARITM